MESQDKAAATLAAHPVLAALAKIMLEEGVSFSEFAELARFAFIAAAEDVLGRDKRITDSRISILTGIHRKEVKRLREADTVEVNPARARSNRAIAVISAWTREPDYCDKKGQPLALAFDTGTPSLTTLIQAYSGDMPVRAVCDELQRLGVIEEKNQRWHLTVPAFVPSKSREAIFNILATDPGDLIATIGHNLNNPPRARRFQRSVCYDELGAESAALFQQFASEDSMQLLKRFDAWLAKREKQDKTARKQSPDLQRVRAGLGIYYFEHTLADEPGGDQ